MLVLLPVAAAFYLLARPGRGREAGAGALLGFAAAFKLTPGLFGLYLIAQRRWTALLAMAVSGFLLVAGLGSIAWGACGNLERHLSWYEMVVRPMAAKGPTAVIAKAYRPLNQSPTAALFRFLHPQAGHAYGYPPSALTKIDYDEIRVNVANLDPAVILKLAAAFRAAVLAVLVVAWWRAWRRGDAFAYGAAFALTVIGTFLLSPVSEHSHHGTLMVPFAVLLAIVLMALTVFSLGKALSTLVFADLVLFAILIHALFAGPQPTGH
jgi:hypothetical protein